MSSECECIELIMGSAEYIIEIVHAYVMYVSVHKHMIGYYCVLVCAICSIYIHTVHVLV